ATAVIGELVAGADLAVVRGGAEVARVPARSLADDGPEYDRPSAAPPAATGEDPTFAPFDGDLADALRALLAAPDVASKRWIFEQYDRLVQGNSLAGPGSDAALVRVGDKAVALATDGRGRYGALDPYLGAMHAVAEAARNVAVTGARPLAITNCLNFGDPERPEVMWQFTESIRGIRDACLALGTPVTGGNVSFYNASGGTAIDPTPVIGMLGLLGDHRLRVPSGFPRPGLAIWLLGETFAELGGSEFARTVLHADGGRPPALDLARELALLRLLEEAAAETVLASAHDCSDGGLAVALAESAIAGGNGFAVAVGGDLPAHVALFAESASRAVVSVDPADEERLLAIAGARGVPAARLGETGGPRAMIDGLLDVPVAELAEVWEGAIPRLLGEIA
ncbi:MAG TPA: AIR synthase related protein, partial [Actinomycetota bacterium]|nr:AIR synthase related protein [Actinomycetota bacterium]